MGNSSSDFENAHPVHLTHDTAFHIFGHEYCSSQPRDLAMKEKMMSFSGDDFSIKDRETEAPVFKIKGKTFSMRDKKKLFDLHGNVIGVIKEKRLTMHRRMYILDTNDNVLVVVRKSHYFQLAAAADAWILRKPVPLDHINKEETKSRPPDICMGGNWRSKNFVFVRNEDKAVIGKTQRSGLNARNILGGKDTYFISVPPYVDAAFLTLLSVTLDEIFRDDDGTRH